MLVAREWRALGVRTALSPLRSVRTLAWPAQAESQRLRAQQRRDRAVCKFASRKKYAVLSISAR